MSLKEYNAKRDFTRTAEPREAADTNKGALKFVVQHHQASSLHYDFRLEMGGVLKSWAVPKGPSLNPRDKRLAMMVEDHPFSYRTFEGDIPEGNYGAGHVDIWDEGDYYAATNPDRKAGEKALLAGLEKGSISFVLQGQKLQGEFSLVEMKGRQKNAWLLVKKNDGQAVHEAYTAEDLAARPDAGKRKAAGEKKPAKVPETKKTRKKETGPDDMPQDLKPMTARLTDEAFDDADWIFETKWDGYRAIAQVRDGAVDLYSRSGKSFRSVYKPIVAELARLGHEAVLDGEVVVLNDQGHASFQDLQNYQNTPHPNLYYYVFDLLYLDGEDLRDRPLLERKQKLEPLLQSFKTLRYSAHVVGTGKDYFKQARKNQVEGIMAKLATSPYRTGRRSEEWLKIKTHLRQEVVIGGFTAPKGSRKHLGALLLGVYEKNQLRYIGQSGSGFNQESLQQLKDSLEPLVQPEPPFAGKVRVSRAATWVKPQLVCEISFAEWTGDGKVRQAIFEGLRPDKTARQVSREKMEHTPDVVAKAEARPAPAAKASQPKSAARKETTRQIGPRQVRLTSLDKLYWPEEKITKGDLIDYYQAIAPVLLPYLKDRAESLLRHPQGIQAPGFFQKDIQDTVPDWVATAAIHAESTGEQVRYLVCQDAATLAYMNNLGCIQLNPWSSRIQHLDQPDWAVIDLDPGENSYDEVVEVALAVKEVADAIGVSCYPKTSGATGMHIYFPLAGNYPFADVKDFAHRFAQKVHQRLPQLTSLERMPKERRYQVYLDYLQNAIGQTIAAPYCVRPRPGATVSAPLGWEEVKKGLHPSQFTLHNMPARLKKQGDLFKGVLGKGLDLKGKIGALMQL